MRPILPVVVEALPGSIDPRLAGRARSGASWVVEQGAAGRTVTVVHHIDADGVTSGAIALEALARAGVASRAHPVKSLDDHHVGLLLGTEPQALWFCDLGSTAYMRFPGLPRLVCDHHELVRDGTEEAFPHVNPLLDGLSGQEISGAGCTYLVAAALGGSNVDLLPLALVGASGDMQDRRSGRFTGTNALLVAHGAKAGLLDERTDLAWYGRETRPLRKYLSSGGDPEVPGLSRDGRSVERFLMDCGIPLDGDRTWSSLAEDEARTVRSRIVERLVDLGLHERADRLFRQVVTLRGEAVGRPTRELQEFATLLNSTARYGRPEVGLAVARGDRGEAYVEALDLLLDHRRHLAGAIDAFGRAGPQELAAIQWVHLGDQVRDTVIGIVCGMAMEGLGLRRDRAVVGLAWTEDGRTKASGRASHELQGRGIDLAAAMREAAALFGGQGGGHKGAAGATIGRSAETAFVAALDGILAAQLGMRPIAADPLVGISPGSPDPLVHSTTAVPGSPAASPAPETIFDRPPAELIN